MKKIVDWIRGEQTKPMTPEEKEQALKRRMKTATKTQNLGVLPPGPEKPDPKKPEKGS